MSTEVKPIVKLIAHTPDPEKVIAMAAKLCYSNKNPLESWENITNEDVTEFLGKLEDYGHMSPVEHASFTFLLMNVSRSLLAQITRHRLASFSVQSQRYVNFNNFGYVFPPEIENSPLVKEIAEEAIQKDAEYYEKIHTQIVYDDIKQHIFENFDEYWGNLDDVKIVEYGEGIEKSAVTVHRDFFDTENKRFDYKRIREIDDISSYDEKDVAKILVKLFSSKDTELHAYYNKLSKVANENARAVLPNACVCNMIVTMNARELLHFFSMRCCNRAQKEIRDVAWEMLNQTKEVAPHIFKNAGPSCVAGKCAEGAMSCGNPYTTMKSNVDEEIV